MLGHSFVIFRMRLPSKVWMQCAPGEVLSCPVLAQEFEILRSGQPIHCEAVTSRLVVRQNPQEALIFSGRRMERMYGGVSASSVEVWFGWPRLSSLAAPDATLGRRSPSSMDRWRQPK
jgi:hypothetical protein